MTRRIFCKVLLVVVAVFGIFVLSGVLLAQGRSEEAFEHVRKVQERNTNRLMAMNGVEGTAIGFNQNDRLAIKVFTAGPGVRGIPQEFDGVPVQVVVTGKFYALEPGKGKGGPPEGKGPKEEVDPTARFDRPVPIGVSTGNVGEISSGTIACRVTGGGKVYALSNNHVYALENTAPIGSEVLQPGRYDDGVAPDDVIGTLSDFEDILFFDEPFDPEVDPVNEIDAAIASTTTDDLGNATPDDGYGTPNSTTATAYVNQRVQKYGRATGLTKGRVYALNATVDVGYGEGKVARFVGQIIITPGSFSAGGDSGSLVVVDGKGRNRADDRKPVGLLFAGSLTMTVANPIDLVLDAFGVTIDGTP